MKDIVEKVVKNQNCVGCGLCSKFYENCYVMNMTSNGFWRPKKIKGVSYKNEIMDRQFKKMCPGYMRNGKNNVTGNSLWGEYKELYTTYSSDKIIRYKSSTGGSLTSILLYMLEKNIVNGVLQLSPIDSKPYINHFCISKNRDEIIKSIGSKYQPCFIFSSISDIKKFAGKLAIVGKPCEISSIKKYINYSNLNEKVYCYISFLCGGTPSFDATLKLLNDNNIDKDEITYMQYRGDGWPGFFKVKKNNEELLKISYVDSWAKNLSKKIQSSCRICTDGIGEEADIVFGDAWRLDDKGKPIFDDNDGINITFARTKKGSELLKKAIENNYLEVECEYLDEEVLNKMQPFHSMHRKNVYYKILARKLLLRNVPQYPIKRFKDYSLENSFFKKVKLVLSEQKRYLKKINK